MTAMATTNVMRAVERWHCRMLGVLWAIAGLAWLGEVLPSTSWWDDMASCFGIILAALLVAVGTGLVFRRVWARWCMLLLLPLAGLVCIEGVLVAGCSGPLSFVVLSLIGLGIALYTWGFIALSLFLIYRD